MNVIIGLYVLHVSPFDVFPFACFFFRDGYYFTLLFFFFFFFFICIYRLFPDIDDYRCIFNTPPLIFYDFSFLFFHSDLFRGCCSGSIVVETRNGSASCPPIPGVCLLSCSLLLCNRMYYVVKLRSGYLMWLLVSKVVRSMRWTDIDIFKDGVRHRCPDMRCAVEPS